MEGILCVPSIVASGVDWLSMLRQVAKPKNGSMDSPVSGLKGRLVPSACVSSKTGAVGRSASNVPRNRQGGQATSPGRRPSGSRRVSLPASSIGCMRRQKQRLQGAKPSQYAPCPDEARESGYVASDARLNAGGIPQAGGLPSAASGQGTNLEPFGNEGRSPRWSMPAPPADRSPDEDHAKGGQPSVSPFQDPD